ncbi:hypothetical protein N7533_012432 [Penicillium manginii]|uniref:uncharacterized protein n=1 Tax=Penicillium manginii TaxID=203109 RepID=UPI0025485DCA|nr:uncharacterized protein N7533_012432 [Penicillium manginii]KAJ5739648.1 hypothetical protein N7533_012432 [Penicillium manginii]
MPQMQQQTRDTLIVTPAEPDGLGRSTGDFLVPSRLRWVLITVLTLVGSAEVLVFSWPWILEED